MMTSLKKWLPSLSFLSKINRSVLVLASSFAAFWVVVSYLLLGGNFRILAMLCVTAGVAIGWLLRPVLGISVLFAYLLLLGDLRRIVDMVMGQRSGLDPMLLIGGVITTLFSVPIFMGLRVRSTMAKMVLGLTGLMLVGIFNPLQGSLLVGVTGAMFYVVPVLWFWIGRAHITEASLTAVFYAVVLPLGVVAALLGIWQTLFGFLPWEQAWIDSVSTVFTALYVGFGQVRSFGFSVNSLEYGNLLLVVTVFVIAEMIHKRRVLVLLLPILGTALLFASMRSVIVHGVLAGIGMWAVATRRTSAIAQRLLFLVFCCVLGFGALSQLGDGGSGKADKSSTAASATSHVTNGFAHPLDSRYSTAGLHFQLVEEGVISGFQHPIGVGIGATTQAAGKFGNGWSSTEIDISDLFVSIGAVGGILYMAFICYTFKKTFELVREDFTGIRLTIWGLEIAMLGQWIGNGQYSIGPIVWICLGYICRVLDAKQKNPAIPRASSASPKLSASPGLAQGI